MSDAAPPPASTGPDASLPDEAPGPPGRLRRLLRGRLWLLLAWGVLPAALVAAIVFFKAGILAIGLYGLLILLVLARVMIACWGAPLACERELSDTVVRIGEHVKVLVRLTNRAPWPVLWLYAEETLPARMPREGTTRRLLFLPPGRSFHLHYRITPVRRGCHMIGPLVIETGDIFGFFRRSRIDPRRDYVTALPDYTVIDEVRIGEPRKLGAMAARRSVFEDTASVRGLREYRRGDALKRVHWKASARLDQLYTRLCDPIAEAAATIVLDFHRDAWARGGRFLAETHKPPEEYAVEISATIARFLHDGGWKVGLFCNGRDPLGRPGLSLAQLTVADEPLSEALSQARETGPDPRLAPIAIPARAGEEQFALIHENLGRIELTDGLPLAELLPLELPHIPRHHTLVVVAGDVSDAFLLALRSARALGYRVMLMSVNNPEAHDKAFELLLPYGIEVYRMDEDWRLRELATGRSYY